MQKREEARENPHMHDRESARMSWVVRCHTQEGSYRFMQRSWQELCFLLGQNPGREGAALDKRYHRWIQ